jgi:hypothetical protein
MCILKIYSDSMSFEHFSETTSLPILGFQVKGRPVRARSDRTYESHRLSIDVSDKDWSDFDGQVADAISFLADHEQELIDLLKSHEATNAFLDFPLYSRLDENIINQNDHLPRELIVLAGRIGLGIGMAIYSKDAMDAAFGDLDS